MHSLTFLGSHHSSWNWGVIFCICVSNLTQLTGSWKIPLERDSKFFKNEILSKLYAATETLFLVATNKKTK